MHIAKVAAKANCTILTVRRGWVVISSGKNIETKTIFKHELKKPNRAPS